MKHTPLRQLAMFCACCVVTGCSERRPQQRPTVTQTTTPDTTKQATRGERVAFDGTIGVVAQARDEQAPTALVAVRTARHEGFDRVVFVFEGRVPGYHVEYIDRPVRQCGSGDAVPVLGDGWLEVRMAPANAHDEQGRALAGPRERLLNLGVLRELELTCDFEAVVTWVLGLTSPNPYRVRELSSPSRLVIDVKHGHR